MGWGDVNKGALGQGGGRFLKLEAGQTVTIRILDEEPESAYVHKISQKVNGEEVFRTIPATVALDDNFIQNNSRRWPATPQHGMRCVVVEDGEPVGDIIAVVGGKQIFGDEGLKKIYDRYGSLTKYDIDITRIGSGRDTKYTVSLAAEHSDIDVEALRAEMAADPAIQWDAIFPVVTGEQQQRMLAEAGFDISYDPAEEIAADMDPEDALAVRMTAGKYKDKTMRELVVVDAGYLTWAADNFTSDDTVAAAARVVVRNMDQIAAAPKRPAVGSGAPKKAEKAATPTKAAPSASRAAPVKESGSEDRKRLTDEINEVFASEPKFEDAMEIAGVISKHGGGKTRIRDLTVDQLTALRDDIKGGGDTDTAPPAGAGRRRRAAGARG